MNDEKVKASPAATVTDIKTAKAAKELHPQTKKDLLFTVMFEPDNEHGNMYLSLHVNGEPYDGIHIDTEVEGQIKFHEALSRVIQKFTDWGFHGKN